jgi:hypothetical protein
MSAGTWGSCRASIVSGVFPWDLDEIGGKRASLRRLSPVCNIDDGWIDGVAVMESAADAG